MPKNEVFPMIDDAWRKVTSGSADVVSMPAITMKSGVTRQVHIIDMNKEIGWFGGKLGAQADNPSVTKLQIVVDNGRDLVSAFPVR